MTFFRNPEIQKGCFFFLFVDIVIIIIGILVGGWIPAMIACILFDFLFLIITYQRYQQIRSLSHEIDQLLHGAKDIDFRRYQEGELAILQNEIAKMTACLNDQAEALRNDRQYLKNSIADISHQLKTPLTSIHLILSLLEQSDITEQRRRELVQEVKGLARKIDWLITALLMLSKLDAGVAEFKREPISVLEVIQKAVEPIAITMELRGLLFHLQCERQIYFTGDFSWSAEAIGNILKNCMEHTPSGGTISVKAIDNELYTEIIIRDTGIGIDPEDLPHIFERFYRGKHSSIHSVGIGLALSRQIIGQQDGTIKAENAPDGGAKFTIRFYKKII